MNPHRSLKAGSVDICGITEWKKVLKRYNYTQEGSLRQTSATVWAINSKGERVGCASQGGHGPLQGFVSSSVEEFKIDWIDEIVRIKEQSVLAVEQWKKSTPAKTGLGKNHAAVVQRHVDGLASTLAQLDMCLEARKGAL